MLKFPHKRIMNLNWRVFSKYIRKPGQNIFYMITLLQIIIALYIFLFYQTMERTADGISESLKYNQFSGAMVFMLFAQIFFIIFERYIYLLSPRKWRDFEMFRFTSQNVDSKKERELLKRISSGLEGETPKEKFRKIVKRLIIVMRIYKIGSKQLKSKIDNLQTTKQDKSKTFDDYRDNPLFKKYIFQICLFVFINSVIFILLPIMGNVKESGEQLCNSMYYESTKSKCNYTNENSYSWFFYCLYTVYFILSAIQIRLGESFLKNQRRSDRRWKL